MGVVIVPIVGHPVSQVQSPGLFNARFRDRGIDALMVGIDLAVDRVPQFIRALRDWRDTPGCVVTMPFKQEMAALVDVRSARAELLGTVNVIRRDADGRLCADMLDGDGFLAAAADHGFTPAGRRAAIIGAGGAGSAIALALRDAGADGVHVMDIVQDRARALAARLGGPVSADLPDPGSLDLIVNASQAGMDGATMPIAEDAMRLLRPDCLVAEMVTKPETTSFLAVALGLGLRVQRGAETAAWQTEQLGRFLGLWP
jgi:shikimate dehydrogenase